MDIGALSAVGPGMMQGQDALQGIRMKALQIQQAQMAIDAQKRELAGAAALFNNMGGMNGLGGNQQPQPPMPGQSSAPANPMSSPATGPQGGPQAAGPSFGGTGTPGGQPAASGPQSASVDQFSPMGEFQTMQRIAQAIKARNPGIDPQTLAAATQQAVEMLKGVTAAQRPTVTMLDTQARIGAQERGQDMTYDARMAQIRASLQKTGETIAAQQERTRFIQGEIDRRSRQGQMNRAQIAAAQGRVRILASELGAGQRQLSSLATALVGEDDPRWQSAQKRIDKAQRGLDALEKGLGIEEADDSGGGEGGSGSDSGAPKVGSAIPLPQNLQSLPDGQSQPADDGTVWQRKGSQLIRVK